MSRLPPRGPKAWSCMIIEIFLHRGLSWDECRNNSFESFMVKLVFAFVFAFVVSGEPTS